MRTVSITRTARSARRSTWTRSRGSWASVPREGPVMSIDTYAAGTCLIVAIAVIAVLGLIAVRRTYNVRNLATIHELSWGTSCPSSGPCMRSSSA